MANNVSDTLKKQQFLSSGIIERLESDGTTWRQLAGFTDLVLSSEPFVKETQPTDDGVPGVKTVRQDGRASFNLRMPKSAVLIEKFFSLPVDYTVGSASSITGELVKCDLKAGDGIYEAVLLKPSGNGAKNTSVVVKDQSGSTTYVLNTDYTIELVNGFTAIRMISGGDIEKDQVLAVDYDYLPLTSAVLTGGEAQVLTAQEYRFREAPDAEGSSITDDLVTFHFSSADVVSGLQMGFPDMALEKDEIEMPIEIENRKGEPFTITFSARS